ncbi:I78 family peptidase inhibitor [Sphingomonas sp. dw_22]|uniref:I78 family peptidase inhibitor n=1 Tax=Sphingomonas sp. dw_22 TaxID=2721175 RepID=UPI001BD68DB0|nr:I78 family peptidase inhibitor [Sphingomonas sp. dw_22]
MIRLALPLIALAAGGCMQNSPPKTEVPGVQCNANGLKRLIGQQRSPEAETLAKQLSNAKTVRWLEPGSVMTMDFRPDRLNLNVDEQGRITSARCG